MIVLGSTYMPMMEALEDKLEAGVALRRFDESLYLIDQVRDVDVLILGHQRVTSDAIAAAENLRLIQQHGPGIDGVDLAAAAHAGVKVANVPGENSVSVAEHTLALILYMARRFYAMPNAIKYRITGAPAGLELTNKTLAIVGIGAAGTELARRARALGLRVIATRAPTGAPPPDVDLAFLGGPGDLHRLLDEADFVVLLAPLTETTRGMIGRQQLTRMKPSAYLINTARGALVDYDALFEALSEDVISGAAFDAYWDEPADPSDPMLALENFFLTPHVAGFSDEAIDHVTSVAADNIRRLSVGDPLLNLIAAP